MKKRMMLVAMAVLLCALVATGSAVAYFSYTTNSVKNVITTGEARIKLQEEKEWSKTQQLSPGKTIAKTPTVVNTGTVAVYARIRMTVDSATAALLKNGELSLQGINTTDWEDMPDSFDNIDAGKGLVIVATLREPLAVGKTSPALFTGVSLTPSYEERESRTLSLTLIAEAVQTIQGKTPEECWGLL